MAYRSTSDYLRRCLATVAAEPQTAWEPAVDAHRCDFGWLVKFELAGIRPSDVHIEVAEGKLTIAGTRRDWRLCESQQPHLMEISYSRFQRTVALPEPVNGAEVHTDYRDGIFSVPPRD